MTFKEFMQRFWEANCLIDIVKKEQAVSKGESE